jgi:xylose isomerase
MQNKNNRGGINFDAKIRRNSTDPADLFYARIGGMDTFARALIVGDKFCRMVNTPNSEKNAIASYDSGKGKEFEEGKLSLEDLRQYAIDNSEPKTISGRQEYLENLINRFI